MVAKARTRRRRVGRICGWCGDLLKPGRTKFCSAGCRALAHGEVRSTKRMSRLDWRTCKDCGQDFSLYFGQAERCRPCQLAKRRAQYRNHSRFWRREVFERDGWTCHLCGDGIDPDLSWPHPRSASIDHVVPISAGGADQPDNALAAHLRCNIVRGNAELGGWPRPAVSAAAD